MNQKIIGIVYLIGIMNLILGIISLYFIIWNLNLYLRLAQSNFIYWHLLIPWWLIFGILVIVLGILLSKET